MAQHCGPTAAVAVVSRDQTFAPRTPATSPENNHRVHLSLVCPRRGLVTGACVQEGGKCHVPAPTAQSLRHTLRVNRHTWPSALVDRAGSPCRTASIGLHSEVIQHSQMLPTRCPQPIVLSHARHLICKCITLTFLNVQIYMYIPCIISINVLFIVLQVTNNCSYRPRI